MKTFHKIVILILLSAIFATVICLSVKLRNNSVQDKKNKKDFFTVNQIKYGLLSGTNWSMQVDRIIEQQVDSFQFTGENRRVLTEQLNGILYRVFDEADAMLHKHQTKLKDRIKFKLINTFVDVDKFKAEVPRFSKVIIDEMDEPKNRQQIKGLLKEKIAKILAVTNQDTLGEQRQVLSRYHYATIEDFNRDMVAKSIAVKEHQKNMSYLLIAMLVAVLLLWVYIIKIKVWYPLFFLYSVVISFSTLFVGVSLPMIEVDARVAKLDLEILSSHIVFNDQIIFYQTKSIIDVVHILITNGKADTVFVGILIFLFSVLFPTAKLICASLYLFIKNKTNKFINYMAFKSGKWSMADVMVVAIFMSFIGFQGILDDQLTGLERHNDYINLVSTNKSNLQPGYLIFISFVLYNLVLAEILEYITGKKALKKQAKADSSL